MPFYHVHASYIKQGAHTGGAQGFAQYLHREGRGEASQLRQYIERDGEQGKDDLVACDSANLPRWARDGEHFFAMADTYERSGWVVARHLQIALPRELAPEARRELADDLREVTVGQFAHVWAIHEPQAQDGSGFQPHIHILKDVHVEKKGWLYDVRSAVAVMTNAALARAGVEAAVSEKRLAAQGFDRPLAIYGQGTKETILAYRSALRDSGQVAHEQLATYAGWQHQALKLMSLDRHYIRDLCRDQVWRFDQSPTRGQEREASMQRAFALAAEQVGRTMRVPSQRRTPQVTAAQHRQRMQAIRMRHEEPQAGAALHIRLFEDEQEHQRQRQHGMSW